MIRKFLNKNKKNKTENKRRTKEMNIKLLAGLDIGNSDLKAYINGDYFKQPTSYSRVIESLKLDEVNPEAIRNDIENNILVTLNSPSAPAGTYYIGKASLNSGLAKYNMDIVETKSKSDVYYITALGILMAYAVKNIPVSELDNTLNVTVDMACSIPVNQYSKDECKVITDRFKAKHNGTIHLGTRRVDVTLQFNYIKVLPESVSLVFALKELEGIDDKRILHVAIGEGTTEYPLTNGLGYDQNFIKGSNNGIGHAIEKSIDPFKERFGFRDYSRQQYSELIQNQSNKYHAVAVDLLQENIVAESETILRYVEREIEKASGDIDMIVVHGGGSILMKKHLEQKLQSLCDKKLIDLFFIDEGNAVSIEAQGLYSFANSDIFNKLRERATGN
jgi:plasmid segregation protein ParM